MAILRDDLGIATFFVLSANEKMSKCKRKNANERMTANEKMQIQKCKLQIEKCKWKNEPGHLVAPGTSSLHRGKAL